MAEILIGTCSWTDPTLIQSGRFYPAGAKSAESRLRFYSSQFPIVEVDSAYYALPGETTVRQWVERTPDRFIFDVKAFRLFTQHPAPPQALPKEIKESLPAGAKHKASLYARDIPGDLLDELWKQFERVLLLLDSAGKLGTVLFQFPPWFYPGNEQRDYILSCQKKLPQFRMAVEFRHNSWLNDRNREQTMSFLRDHDLPFVCVDEPQGFKSSIPPLVEATSDIGLVRFHGRNRDTWEKPGIGATERFNYLYNNEELGEWVPRIRELAGKTQQLHILFNNCHQDKAVVNARQMGYLLTEEPRWLENLDAAAKA